MDGSSVPAADIRGQVRVKANPSAISAAFFAGCFQHHSSVKRVLFGTVLRIYGRPRMAFPETVEVLLAEKR